jgi:predicted Rossmann fold flavoprotein
MKVAVIGGGAAGFFCAIHIKIFHPNAEVTIYEGSEKVLSKILISGGGRCNVTNKISKPEALSKNYPRGATFLKNAFQQFSSNDTQQWFQSRGVILKTESDGRVFPVSNSSQDIANCLIHECKKLHIPIQTKKRLKNLIPNNNQWELQFTEKRFTADRVVIATGGSKPIWNMLENLGLHIIAPVPSLFTFKLKDNPFYELSGISVQNASIIIPKSDISQQGPLLLTHEGISGPAVLKTSAWGAFEMAKINYQTTLEINWLPHFSEKQFTAAIREKIQLRSKEKVSHIIKNELPKRLWNHILVQCSISPFTNYAEFGKKKMNLLLKNLFHYPIEMIGKSTFKEEFVTAGGVFLDEINPENFKSHQFPNLSIIGEALNIDAITGGFNFQAAWTGGFIAGREMR